ncbi:MAG: DUF1648 domain-containing protein [Rothia sp. (in: high G+C Gram-positive bacteria)]|nr:DUF1648 domain-containing protein [Rothia sp. (in: high G+C Gram-positive bacteria)]
MPSTQDYQAQITQPSGEPLRAPRAWFFVSALVLLAWAAFLVIKYPELPDPYPIHFNAVGEADGWADKSVGSVFMGFFAGAFAFAAMWLCSGLMVRQLNAAFRRGDTTLPSLSIASPKDAEACSAALGVSVDNYLLLRNRAVLQKSLKQVGLLAFLLTGGICFLDVGKILPTPGWLQSISLLLFIAVLLGFAVFMTWTVKRAPRQFDEAALAAQD